MLNNLFLKSLRDERGALVWWGIGLILLSGIIIIIYPSVREAGDALQQYQESFPEELMGLFAGEITDMASPEGYLKAELFFLTVPMLFLIYTITKGSGTIAADEKRGTLELLLSFPITRRQVVLQKFFGMVIATLILALIFFVALILASIPAGMGISFLRVGEATLSAAMLGVMFGTFALTLGASTGNRGISVGITCGIAVMSYLLNALGPFVPWLDPLYMISPFHLYIGSDPLINGLNPLHAFGLIFPTIVSVAVAIMFFERRNICV